MEIRRFLSETENALDKLPAWLEENFPHLGPVPKSVIFLAYFKPDENGRTRRVYMSELADKYHEFRPGNGCDWARTNHCGLGKKFKVNRYDRNGRLTEFGNAVFSLELAGFNTSKFNQYIPANVRKFYRGCGCVICNSHSQIQIDHKIGVKIETATRIEDYQVLCRHHNDVKREVCKECMRTKKRPDARNLPGFSRCPFGWTHGGEALNLNLKNPCEGCIYHDYLKFMDYVWTWMYSHIR